MSVVVGDRQNYIRMTEAEKLLGTHRQTINRRLQELRIQTYRGLDHRERLIDREALQQLTRIEPRQNAA